MLLIGLLLLCNKKKHGCTTDVHSDDFICTFCEGRGCDHELLNTTTLSNCERLLSPDRACQWLHCCSPCVFVSWLIFFETLSTREFTVVLVCYCCRPSCSMFLNRASSFPDSHFTLCVSPQSTKLLQSFSLAACVCVSVSEWVCDVGKPVLRVCEVNVSAQRRPEVSPEPQDLHQQHHHHALSGLNHYHIHTYSTLSMPCTTTGFELYPIFAGLLRNTVFGNTWLKNILSRLIPAIRNTNPV